MARSLENALWVTDSIGRWSDDQFVVILSGCTAAGLPGVRERLRHILAGEGIEWWGERRSLPISIGEAVPQAEDNVNSVISRAEKSLEAVSAWRNQVLAASAGQSSGS
jgi:GGDEF domain-containing protein